MPPFELFEILIGILSLLNQKLCVELGEYSTQFDYKGLIINIQKN